MAALSPEMARDRHVPVLLAEVCAAAQPLAGAVVVDGTFGAGGYTRAFLEAGAAKVVAIDRDPTALEAARGWADVEPRLALTEGTFGAMDELVDKLVDAVVLDIGVSSMQLDQAERGFSFMRDGPLDMRMAAEGVSAADLVNGLGEDAMVRIFRGFGEERAAKRIARAIIRARGAAPITTTLALANIIADALPAQRPGQNHPATRVFQALRIAVNDELGQLVSGLTAAERLLKPGGRLVVVTFHSLEDRIVKRFFQLGAAVTDGGSRHAPQRSLPPARWDRPPKAVAPSDAETGVNPRARSARLRVAVRTDAPPVPYLPNALGLPALAPVDELLKGSRR